MGLGSRSRRQLIEVGFWKEAPISLGGPQHALAQVLFAFTQSLLHGYPDVRRFVDPDWDPKQRNDVVRYLKSVPRGICYFGHSTCRFCGKDNGSADMEDGTYVWPEGFAHYLEEHHVRPPNDFVQHALEKGRRR